MAPCADCGGWIYAAQKSIITCYKPLTFVHETCPTRPSS